MTYFFIFPAFLIYLLICGVLLLIAAIARPAKFLFPYLWRPFLASILGFFAANISLWAIVLALAKTLNTANPSDKIRELLGVPAGLALLLGPIPVSIIGVISGIVIGIVWALYAKRRYIRNEK